MKWVTESRMAQLCGLARSTWQSWVREGLFEIPPAGAFGVTDCLEVALVAALREHFSLLETKTVWEGLRHSGEASRLIEQAAALEEQGYFDLIIDPADGDVVLAVDNDSLAQAIRRDDQRRLVSVVPLANELRRIHNGFSNMASSKPIPAARRGRPRKTPAAVIELRSRR